MIFNDSYEVNDNILPAPDNKPIPTGDTDRTVYKEVCKWNGIDHRSEAGCWIDAAKIDEMKE